MSDNVVFREVMETANVVSTAYDAMYTARHPFKSCFKKIGTFFVKKKVVEPAIETLNENFIEPVKERGTNFLGAAKETFNNVVEKGKNFMKKASFNLKEKLVDVTDKEKKINTIELFIGENGQADDVIASYDEGDVKLNFKDRLEIIKYAIERDRIETAKSLIEREAGIIRSNIEKFEKRKNKIAELKKKNEELTKKYEVKNKWYGKVINFFNRGYFTKVESELNDNKNKINVKVEKNKNLIRENEIEYSLAYKHEDNSFNSDYINNFNNSVEKERRNNSELNYALNSLNNAITDINMLFNANPSRENKI